LVGTTSSRTKEKSGSMNLSHVALLGPSRGKKEFTSPRKERGGKEGRTWPGENMSKKKSRTFFTNAS